MAAARSRWTRPSRFVIVPSFSSAAEAGTVVVTQPVELSWNIVTWSAKKQRPRAARQRSPPGHVPTGSAPSRTIALTVPSSARRSASSGVVPPRPAARQPTSLAAAGVRSTLASSSWAAWASTAATGSEIRPVQTITARRSPSAVASSPRPAAASSSAVCAVPGAVEMCWAPLATSSRVPPAPTVISFAPRCSARRIRSSITGTRCTGSTSPTTTTAPASSMSAMRAM